MNHAIPTVYEGIEYRSRLEARWAAMFDNLGWRYTYEPFDGNGYIPDFLIHGDEPLLVEIKLAVTVAEYCAPIDKITRGLREHWTHDVLILGADPMLGLDNPTAYDLDPAAGLLGERYAKNLQPTLDGVRIDESIFEQLKLSVAQLWKSVRWAEFECPTRWNYATGCWFRCCKCNTICVYHIEQSWYGRPCGHYDGGRHIESIDPADIKWMWSQACNAVKWHGRDASDLSRKDIHRSASARGIDFMGRRLDAPIPVTAPVGIHQHEWDNMPGAAKQEISNIVADSWKDIHG